MLWFHSFKFCAIILSSQISCFLPSISFFMPTLTCLFVENLSFSQLDNSAFNSKINQITTRWVGNSCLLFGSHLTRRHSTITCLAWVQMSVFPTSSPCYFLSRSPQCPKPCIPPPPPQEMNSHLPYPMTLRLLGLALHSCNIIFSTFNLCGLLCVLPLLPSPTVDSFL